MTAATPPDPNTKMTERARTVWSLGDFARAGAEQVIVGELLCRAIDIHPGERVLDVAAGSGNAALAAARRGANVTATDFVPTLLQTAGASYTRRFGRYVTRFQLNITNLTDNDHPIWGRNGASGAYTTVAANAYLNGNPRMQIMNNFTQYDPRKFTFTTTVSF